VKGAPFETVPKRRSQLACGPLDSRSNHWALAFSSQASGLVPLGGPVEGEERFEEKFLSAWG
jgi:hypothetical protein